MDLGDDLVEGIFLERLNRFLARVEVDGREVDVHVANSGRMKELFVPGWRVLVRPVSGNHRKTKFDLVLVDMGNALASADARMPNPLLAEGVANGHLQQFAGYTDMRREVIFGDSRLDLMLEGPLGLCYIEANRSPWLRTASASFQMLRPPVEQSTCVPLKPCLRPVTGPRWSSWSNGPTPAHSPPAILRTRTLLMRSGLR